MDIKEAVKQRYADEACCDDNLSCGGQNVYMVDLKAGQWLLDIGCGRGSDVLKAAALVGEQGKAVGVDLSPDMIKAAATTAEQQGVSNVEFYQGDVEALPLPDSVFDAVISDCAINHALDKKRAYAEIFRVLKPQGVMVVSDVVALETLPQEIKDDPAAWADCFGGAISEEDYIDAVKTAGFAEIDMLKRREYIKNGYKMASITLKAVKEVIS
jgi:ubiquinone/menaquinone biosynthesis C-methylase UbiE